MILMFTSVISKIALFIHYQNNSIKEPFTSLWMKSTQKLVQFLCVTALRICGLSVTYKGHMASVNEAPIVVTAPHSTFIDCNILVLMENPSTFVLAEEFTHIPMLGSIVQLFQPIYVRRDDPHSRENVKKEVLSRTSSVNEGWSQVVFSPEGMCSNRKALLPYKLGAFYPGKPIQPIMARYPNAIDTVTWTYDQAHGAMSVAWITLAQPFTRVEVEYLPVYHPSPQEKEDPKLYASNLRKLMAAHYKIPTVDMTYDDAKKRNAKNNEKNIRRLSHKDE